LTELCANAVALRHTSMLYCPDRVEQWD